jgi:hypothetical protein
LAHAQSNHLALPLTEQTLKNFDQAAADGFDDLDCTQIPVWWLKEQVKKQVKPHP